MLGGITHSILSYSSELEGRLRTAAVGEGFIVREDSFPPQMNMKITNHYLPDEEARSEVYDRVIMMIWSYILPFLTYERCLHMPIMLMS